MEIQQEFEVGPKTELGKAADDYVNHCHEIAKHKEALKLISDKIMIELKKEAGIMMLADLKKLMDDTEGWDIGALRGRLRQFVKENEKAPAEDCVGARVGKN